MSISGQRPLGPVHRRFRSFADSLWYLRMAVACVVERPRWTDSESAGFNGQKLRKRLFRELVDACAFDAIMETGTCMGDTTGYMATVTGLPVYTCEINERFLGIARRRLAGLPDAGEVTFRLGDSRAFLRDLAATPLARQNVLVYLDAHWDGELPLVEELDIVCRGWQRFVVMIDDFQVPGDAGYAYADWGMPLNLAAIAPAVGEHDLVPFFPSAPSVEAGGSPPGCVVLARRGQTADVLGALPSLRTVQAKRSRQ